MLDAGELRPTFSRLVAAARRALDIRVSARAEGYVVQLLVAFTRPATADLLDPPLGPSFLAALHLPRTQRHAELRRVGDTTLFLTGLFAERLERTLVGPPYYVALGRSAYRHLARDCRDAEMARSYAEISARFADFVRVLGTLAERHVFADATDDVLRSYRRWLTTRSGRDAATLMRHRIIPWAPPDGGPLN